MSMLAATLDQVKIVHVRGTPASGKTRLSELLRDYYEEKGTKVFLLTNWKSRNEVGPSGRLSEIDPWGSLSKLVVSWDPYPGKLSPESKEKKDPGWVLTSNVVILVDEAQKTYGDDTLWNTIMKGYKDACGINFKLCLFCSFGSPASGPDMTFFTPETILNSQRISLTPQNQRGSPPIGLFYSKDEFYDVVSRSLTYRYTEKFNFDGQALDYIFALTNGHPGAVHSMLDVLYEVCDMHISSSILCIERGLIELES